MYIDTGGAGAAATFGAIGAGMATLKQAAVGKSFAVNETGGQALLAAIRNMKDWADSKRADLQYLAQEPELGVSHGAQTMRQFVPQVASDNQGFITMLVEFRKSLDDAELGIEQAMRNYQEMDQGNMQRYA
jgi:hypothetical protein